MVRTGLNWCREAHARFPPPFIRSLRALSLVQEGKKPSATLSMTCRGLRSPGEQAGFLNTTVCGPLRSWSSHPSLSRKPCDKKKKESAYQQKRFRHPFFVFVGEKGGGGAVHGVLINVLRSISSQAPWKSRVRTRLSAAGTRAVAGGWSSWLHLRQRLNVRQGVT